MTVAQQQRLARTLVGAAARKEGLPYSVIALAFGLSRQRVKAMLEQARRELMVRTGGDDFVPGDGHEDF